jgi:hypothetical protein
VLVKAGAGSGGCGKGRAAGRWRPSPFAEGKWRGRALQNLKFYACDPVSVTLLD